MPGVSPGYGPPKVGRLRPGRRRPLAMTAVGGLAPPVTLIPWTWLSPPWSLRTDQPINHAEVTTTAGLTSTADAAASQAAFGVFPAAGELATAIPADAAAFAAMLVAYYANPLVRSPGLPLDLVPRTPAERAVILGMEIGQRFTLAQSLIVDATGPILIPVPVALPAGVLSLVIEGIGHASSVTSRLVTWTTSPLIGAVVGAEGPWFRLDSSTWDGPDVVPF